VFVTERIETNFLHRKIEKRLHPIFYCLIRARQRDGIRAKDSLARDEQSAQRAVVDVRLALVDLLRGDDAHVHLAVVVRLL